MANMVRRVKSYIGRKGLLYVDYMLPYESKYKGRQNCPTRSVWAAYSQERGWRLVYNRVLLFPLVRDSRPELRCCSHAIPYLKLRLSHTILLHEVTYSLKAPPRTDRNQAQPLSHSLATLRGFFGLLYKPSLRGDDEPELRCSLDRIHSMGQYERGNLHLLQNRLQRCRRKTTSAVYVLEKIGRGERI